MLTKLWLAAEFGLLGLATAQAASQPFETTIHYENKVFTPEVVEVPAGQRIRLTLINHDNEDEEFDSSDLGREVIIPAKGQTTVYLRGLKAGSYDFVAELNPATGQGRVVAR